MTILKFLFPMISDFFYYFQWKYQNSSIVFETIEYIQYFSWAMLQNSISAIEKQNFIEYLLFGDGGLKFISFFSKWLNFKRDLHYHLAYNMWY